MGVRVVSVNPRTFRPRTVCPFPWAWSWSSVADDEGPGLCCPGVLYVAAKCDPSFWHRRLHDIAHVVTASHDEGVTAGWAGAMLIERYGRRAPEVEAMRQYDATADCPGWPDIFRIARAAGFLTHDFRPKWKCE